MRELEDLSRESRRPLSEVRELFYERAAIREFLGHFPRQVAEARALDDVRAILGER